MNSRTMLLQRQSETVADTLSKLESKHRCAVVRPTGFGKTYLMCKIADTYNRVMYIYPADIVKESAKSMLNNNNVHFHSYVYLSRTYCDENETNKNRIDKEQEVIRHFTEDFDLIIFDEIHHMGGSKAQKMIDKILNSAEKTGVHVLGGTATPLRMDGYDIIDDFFNQQIAYPYGLDDMIIDGLIKTPYYVYALSSNDTYLDQIKDRIKKIRSNAVLTNYTLDINLRDKIGQVANKINAPEIIKEALTKNNIDTNYMKFIVFYSTISMLETKYKEVVNWFKKAYPKHKIRVLKVYSKGSEKDNIFKVNSLTNQDNTIDLIFSVNMLNEGYHIGTLTGCILLRPTRSSTVFIQQAGRSIAVCSNNTPIIFDFVDNLNVEKLFDMEPVPVTPAATSLNEQLEKLNKLSGKNVKIIDIVANTEKIISGLTSKLPSDIELEILSLRAKQMPAGMIAKTTKQNVYRVLEILYKHRDPLNLIGLQIQERDKYIIGGTSVEEAEGPKIDISKYVT